MEELLTHYFVRLAYQPFFVMPMPPRGSEGLDFTPILTHYLFLFTSVLAIVSSPPLDSIDHMSIPGQAAWFVTFISQIFVEARTSLFRIFRGVTLT